MTKALIRILSGLMIVLGVGLIALYVSDDLSFWVLIIGNLLLIAGLDIRYATIRLQIKQYAKKELGTEE